jgi:hypothetical protein
MLNVIDQRQVDVTANDRRTIIARIADAPFSVDVRPLKEWARIALSSFVGMPHPSRPSQPMDAETELTSVEYHVLKHTLDGGWPPGTTPDEYIRDIRTAVRDVAAKLDLGRQRLNYRGIAERMAPRAATRTDVFKTTRAESDMCTMVVYDPGRSKVCSGYRLTNDDAEDTLAKWNPRCRL